MHEIQSALLHAIQERGITHVPPLRLLAEFTGKDLSAQQVKHHLEQLQRKGFLAINQKTKAIIVFPNLHSKQKKPTFLSLPIYGAVNCGPALNLVEEKPEAFLKISPSLLKYSDSSSLFVVKASGDSMNKAQVNKRSIEDGDYLVIDSSKKNPVGHGEIVLSIIDGAANVKRFFKEDQHIVLMADSNKNYPPIYISSGENFLINGEIVEVLKRPKKILNAT